MAQPLDIAIIGMAGAYAGSKDAPTFWQNILDKVDAVAEAGSEWAGPYLDPASKANDRIYTTRGGFLRDLAEVDLSELGVMPNTLDGGEPDHMLALRFARDALADAGYLKKSFDRERIGIVLGRGTYANRGILTMVQHGMIMDQTIDLIRGLRPDLSETELATLKAGLKKQLPPYNAEMVGLLTPNVIAGLIANRLDLMGPNFIVDAVCASSLIAIELATREINSGRCDMMITGGVQAQCPPQLYMQFCQINALSHGQLRPFQKGADGTLLGEGVGVLVLKKLSLAEADGDRIYAVIKGIGSASDGKAKGLLTPRLEGEVLALKRAYESSGIDPATIGLVEAHGTGTRVGDKTEIESLTTLFGPRVGELPTIALGSVKSMISHCLPASGSASMIKIALALHHKVLPPMLCDEVDPELHIERTPFYINTEARPWIHGGPHPRRAGVNAFGFGGINAHVILEEYRPSKPVPHKPAAGILHVPGHSELIALAAESVEALVARASRLLTHARGPSKPSLAMLARSACIDAFGEHRLAIIASDPADLVAKLEQALARLAKPDVQPFRIRAGVHYGRGAVPGKVCFVFPGEGAQYGGMLADLALSFPQVREWFDFIDDSAARRSSRPRGPIVFPPPTAISAEVRERLDSDLYEMDVAAETVFAASIGLYTLLDELGFEPDAMLGHSTGENTALTASGVRRYSHRSEIADTVRDLNRIYRELDREGRIVEGSLLTIGALKADGRRALLAECAARDSGILVAMDNCPNQLVLFGSRFDIADLKNRLTAEGAICAELPFGRAYHTVLFAPVADAYREYYADLEFGPGRTVLYSACSVAPFPDDAADIRELACQQWQSPVRFTETVERLYEDGVRVFVEVGPSGNLTSFIDDVLRDKNDLVALSTNSRRKAGVTHLHQTLAQLFALGVGFDPAKLYSHREIPALDLDAAPAPVPKLKPKIKLQMPLVHLPDGTPPMPVAAAAAVTPAPVAAPAAQPVPTPVAGLAVSAPLDPRLEALKSHFALMQDFLDSQARVLDGYTGGALPAAADPNRPDPQAWPLLGRIVEQDARHLVCERRYDLDTDLFLQDHALGSAPSARQPQLRALSVIPFTFSMEIVAEAACLLAGDDLQLIGLDGSRGHRWLGLDGGTLDLKISAERIVADPAQPGVERVSVRLFQLGAGGPAGGVLVFESTALLAASFPAAPAVRPWTAAESRATRSNPDGTLYSRGMFHGPRLQGVTSIRRWADEAIEADMVTIATADYFRDTAQPRFRTDPALLDAAGQVVGYWLTERYTWGFNCFPYHVGSFRQYAPMPAAGSRVVCRCDVRMTDALRIEAHLDVLDADGRLLMRATQWEDRKFTVPERYYGFRMAPQTGALGEPYQAETLAAAGVVARRVAAFDDGFLDQGFSIWKRVLANLVLNEAERREWYALPAIGALRERSLLARIAAKEAVRAWLQQVAGVVVASADVALTSGADGRLHVASVAGLSLAALPSISVAGPGEPALAACVGPGLGIGIDCRRLDAGTVGPDAGLLSAAERQRHAGMLSPADQSRALAALVAAKHAAARSAGRSHASGDDWQVVDGAVPQAAAPVGAVMVRHEGHDHPVALHLGPDEVFALSLVPEAAQRDPRATLA
jgi:acyl transferase domain-containing protein